MRKTLLTALNTLMMLTFATVAFAADGDGFSTGFGLTAIGMAIGIGIAAAGCCAAGNHGNGICSPLVL